MTAKAKTKKVKKPSELEKIKRHLALLDAYVMENDMEQKHSISVQLREFKEEGD